MLYKLVKNKEGIGSRLYIYELLINPSEFSCPECSEKHKLNDLVLAEFKTDISKDGDLKKGVSYSYMNKIYCLNCGLKLKKPGLLGFIEGVENET